MADRRGAFKLQKCPGTSLPMTNAPPAAVLLLALTYPSTGAPAEEWSRSIDGTVLGKEGSGTLLGNTVLLFGFRKVEQST